MYGEEKDDRLPAWATWSIIIAAILMLGWSTYVFKNNTYMEYRNVPVTFVDRWASESCHKGSCRDRLLGLFKTDDGVFFERHISLYMFRQMRLGERFDLHLRQMDIKQTERDNVLWFFGPVLVYIVTFMLWAIIIIGYSTDLISYIKKRKAQGVKNGNQRQARRKLP